MGEAADDAAQSADRGNVGGKHLDFSLRVGQMTVRSRPLPHKGDRIIPPGVFDISVPFASVRRNLNMPRPPVSMGMRQRSK